MATKIAKLNHSDLPNQVGGTVVIRSNTDNSQVSGEVLAIEGSNVLVRKGRMQFYVPTTNTSTQYVYTEQK